jgi:hypothetical protein
MRTKQGQGQEQVAGCRARLLLRLPLLLLLSLLLHSCGPKAYPSSRPKFGDSMAPVGPSKDAFKSQPKFQP